MSTKYQRIALMVAIAVSLLVGIGFMYGGLAPLLAGTGEAGVAGIMAHNASYYAYSFTGGAMILVSLMMLAVLGHNKRQQRLLNP